MITKLKWQWQSSNNDLAHASTATRTSNPNPHTGRVITGMLTGGTSDQNHITPTRTSGKGNRGSDY
jgi:hypothetical protein